ncbi:MAG: hypothetical protein CMJ32_06725 [Phycisphaerae bacterium]|nr:hypothetical protein [Phycisphaerae bacterium]
MTGDGPIFICGTARSGTAMMSSILNAHGDLWISGETHYFDDLRDRFTNPSTHRPSQEEARACEDYFLRLYHRPYGHEGDPGMHPERRAPLQEQAKKLGGAPDDYFTAFCMLDAKEHGRDRWGEKTPRHALRLNEMLERFEDARVICMVRDPRAVVLSYRDWRNQGGFDLEKDPTHAEALQRQALRSRKSYHPITISLIWNRTIESARGAIERFGEDRIRMQSYERLCTEPEASTREIADFLGIPCRESMLDVPMHNSSFTRFDQKGGIKETAIDRWKQKLSPGEIAIIQRWSGRLMEQEGYELIDTGTRLLARAGATVTFPWSAARAVMANRDRFSNLPGYIMTRMFGRK